MNIQDYISTGILESYVLGLATEDEKLEVETMARQYPEIAEEIRAIELAFENLAMQQQVAPPPSVKAKLMEQIHNAPVTNHRNEPSATGSKTISLTYWSVAAAVILLIASIAVNAILYNRWQNTRQNYTALLAEKEVIAQRLQVNEERYESITQELAWLQQPGIQIISLKPTGIEPQAQATVYWQPATSEVYLAVNNLPAPPAGRQYQLWAIVGGTPVDAGVIELESNRQVLHPMRGTARAEAFAITLEQAGGSPTPTLDAMYVMGTV